jgi:hypothetical protein
MIKYEVPNTYFVLSFFDMQSVIWLSIDQMISLMTTGR